MRRRRFLILALSAVPAAMVGIAGSLIKPPEPPLWVTADEFVELLRLDGYLHADNSHHHDPTLMGWLNGREVRFRYGGGERG